MFRYTSVQSHGMIGPNGEKIKETRVNVMNNKGTKTVTVRDNDGEHSDTIHLKKSEIENIKKHRFMPEFFKKSMKNIKRKKSNAITRTSKKVSKSKK
uniref:Uncharacterized protein n=1 Tax=viral metagenome TaxID=1070528 RepID=A0A6C0D8Z3_9ZZZZ